MPRTPNHWAPPKSRNNVPSFFFNAGHLIQNSLGSNMETPNLFLAAGEPNLGTPFLSHRGLFSKIPSVVLAPELIFFRSLLKIHDHR